MFRCAVAGLVSVALLQGAAIRAQEQQGRAAAAPRVLEVADTTLRDLAVAVYHPTRPVIYYNPVLLQRVGPLLAAFFMAHEYGHIHFRHTRANALSAGPDARDSVLQERELEADCYAARSLAGRNDAAVQAAARFFSRMGSFRFDAEHPTGARRAATVLSCLPAPAPVPEAQGPEIVTVADGTPVRIRIEAAAPVSGTPRTVRFRLADTTSGQVSTLQALQASTVRTLPAGTYEYEVEVEQYTLDDLLQLTPGGVVTGRGQVSIRADLTLRVAVSPAGDAVLVSSTAVPNS